MTKSSYSTKNKYQQLFIISLTENHNRQIFAPGKYSYNQTPKHK